MTSKPALSWSQLFPSEAPAHPVLVVGEERDIRRRAISALAAERAENGDAVLWVGSEHVARPLPWLSTLREQRLDARPLRPDLGDEPWPGVNPFDLAPDLRVAWLAHVTSANGREQERIYDAVHAQEASRASRPSRWSALPFPEGTTDLIRRGAPLPDAWLGSNPPRGVRRRTTLSFAGADLTVVCGHPQDMTDRRKEIVLALLAFVTPARRSESREHLVVVDGWLDRLHPPERTLVLAVLADAAAENAVRVVAASSRPQLWDDPQTAAFVWSAVPVVVSPFSPAPEPLAAPEAAVPATRPFGSHEWVPVVLPPVAGGG